MRHALLAVAVTAMLCVGSPSAATRYTTYPNGRIDTSASLDATAAASDPEWAYRLSGGYATWNGTNGPRGNAIDVEAANGAGASYFFPWYVNATHASPGSFANFTGYLTVSDERDAANGGPRYREGNILYGRLICDSKGAYCAPVETSVHTILFKPSKAVGNTVAIVEANPLSAYAALFGAGSPWAVSGSRGVHVISQGPQPAGSALFVDGAFVHGVYAYQSDPVMPVVASRWPGQSFDRMQLLADGSLLIGDGTSAPAAKLYVQGGALKFRGGAGTVTTLAAP